MSQMALRRITEPQRALRAAIGIALLSGVPLGVHAHTQALVDVPLQKIDVTVNARGPFVFGLDTGASGEAWVTRTFADQLGFPAVGSSRVADGSGTNSRPAHRVRIDSLKIGELSFTNIVAIVLDQTDGSQSGTLGFELFRNYVVSYDYPGQRFRVTTNGLPTADEKTILSYSLDHGSPQVAIMLSGIRMNAFIDSGSGGGIVLPRSFSARLPLHSAVSLAGRVASALNEFDLYRAELDGDFECGEVHIHNPTVFFSDLVQQPTVGRAVLQQLIVTFDQTTRRLRLQMPSQSPSNR